MVLTRIGSLNGETPLENLRKQNDYKRAQAHDRMWKQERKQLDDARHELSAVEIEILELTLGLEGRRRWTPEEIAQKLGITREEVAELGATASRKLSKYEDPVERAQSQDLMRRHLQKGLDDARHKLSADEIEVIELLICSEDGLSFNYEEIASKLGETQEEIHRIFSTAMRKLFPDGGTHYGIPRE